jgi:hypothetical protein
MAQDLTGTGKWEGRDDLSMIGSRPTVFPAEPTPTGGAVWLVIITFAIVLFGLLMAMIGMGFNTTG